MPLIIFPTHVAELYKTLDTIGCLGESREAGYLRAAYSNEETAAMKFIECEATKFGATSRWDQLQNLSLEWPGTSPEFVEVGSHLDTVPSGGNFDGVAGIVSGLLAIKAIKENHKEGSCGFRLRIWRAEESGTFRIVYGGSRAAFGKIDPSNLQYKFEGRTYEEAMKSQGADPEIIRKKQRTIHQDEIDKITAHIELHIEQANLLEKKNVDVGIVTSIRGPKRFQVVLKGEFDHSGATPMGAVYRKDVNLAMAYIQVELDKLARAFLERGEDLVQTVGVINCNPDYNQSHPIIYSNSLTTISGFGYFTFDVRSNSKSTLDTFCLRACELIPLFASEFGVTTEITPLTESAPVESLSEKVQSALEESAKALEISSVRMASGAGHDAAIVAQQSKSDGSKVPVGMLFIPCRNGKSHSPDEFTTIEAIAKGASVLANALEKLSKS